METAMALAERLFYPVFVYGRVILIFWLLLAFGADNPPLLLAFMLGSLAILAVAERLLPYRTDWLESGDPQTLGEMGGMGGFGGGFFSVPSDDAAQQRE